MVGSCAACGQLTFGGLKSGNKRFCSENCKAKGGNLVDPASQAAGNTTCPYCAEEIKAAATVCPHCRHTIFSKNKAQNAVLAIVAFVALYFLYSSFIHWQAGQETDRIMRDAEQRTQEMMQRLSQ